MCLYPTYPLFIFLLYSLYVHTYWWSLCLYTLSWESSISCLPQEPLEPQSMTLQEYPRLGTRAYTNYPAWNNIAPLGWLAGSVSHVVMSALEQCKYNLYETLHEMLASPDWKLQATVFLFQGTAMFCGFFASRETSSFGKYQWQDWLYSSTTGNMNGQKHNLLDRTDFVMDFFGRHPGAIAPPYAAQQKKLACWPMPASFQTNCTAIDVGFKQVSIETQSLDRYSNLMPPAVLYIYI